MRVHVRTMTYQMRGGRRLLVFAVAIAIWAPSAVGQVSVQGGGSTAAADSGDIKLPVYDVVSIKLNKSGSGSVNVHSDDNRYSASNVSLKDLLENAYGIKKDLISGVSGQVGLRVSMLRRRLWIVILMR
jgi:hypothetical protein